MTPSGESNICIPNCTKKIMWLLIKNMHGKFQDEIIVINQKNTCISCNHAKIVPSRDHA